MIGESLGNYRIISKIGQGGMGVVYRAHDEVLHRDVALKVLAEGAAGNESTRDHVLHEARASSGSHPSRHLHHSPGRRIQRRALHRHGAGAGQDAERADRATGLAAESVMNYGAQIAASFGACARPRYRASRLEKLQHRRHSRGLVKILDFGLARRLPEAMLKKPRRRFGSLGILGAIAGTLSYMAPEVLRGQEADARSDLWALGVVLYEAAPRNCRFTDAPASKSVRRSCTKCRRASCARSTELVVDHPTLPGERTRATLPARQ